ncbi:MAG: hypothetical protein ACYCPV_04065, partial [Thermoplasmata archaeon]
EFSRLMEGASEYLGTSRKVPDRTLNSLDDLEKQIGTIDNILGPIPKQDELLSEIKSIEDEIKAESDESTSMAQPYTDRVAKAVTGPDLPPADELAPAPPAPTGPSGAAKAAVAPAPPPGAPATPARKPTATPPPP